MRRATCKETNLNMANIDLLSEQSQKEKKFIWNGGTPQKIQLLLVYNHKLRTCGQQEKRNRSNVPRVGDTDDDSWKKLRRNNDRTTNNRNRSKQNYGHPFIIVKETFQLNIGELPSAKVIHDFKTLLDLC